jgi:two-component system NarL family response regulator
MSIRVVLADDHKLLVAALRAMLAKESDIEVLGEAFDGAALLKLVDETRPDVAVVDIGMPGMNGIVATRRLVGVHPQIKVIGLSVYADTHFVVEMLRAGACGYLIKSTAGDELARAICASMQNQTYLCPEIAADVTRAMRRDSAGRGNKTKTLLGRRELEVLRLLAEGNTSPQIGRQLNIAPGTVEVHRRNIMRKLRLHNIAELTKYAIREGLTTP